ncbi:hypothetical protein LJB95_02715 [Paludibacteraceae bacterium OttesenSCG-928-F17]|nr:hypothetical protein [Paludibacteraceae bacterium OttesenSCG-928-F17]
MKKIKLFALCLAASAFVFTGCDKDKGGDGGDNGITTITINVENGADYEADSVYMTAYKYDTLGYVADEVILARAAYNGGKISLSPTAPPANLLDNVTNINNKFDYLTISDETVKMLSNFSFIVLKDGKKIGDLDFEDSPTNSSMEGWYTYADKKVNITGEEVSEIWKEKIVFNVAFNQGWNVMRVVYREDNGYDVWDYTANNVQGLKWFFDADAQ